MFIAQSFIRLYKVFIETFQEASSPMESISRFLKMLKSLNLNKDTPPVVLNNIINNTITVNRILEMIF